MYRIESRSTMDEINTMGATGLGVSDVEMGRQRLDAIEVNKILTQMKDRNERIVCMSFRDRGPVIISKDKFNGFISDFLIITNKDNHTCPWPPKKCLEATKKILNWLNCYGVEFELADLVAGAA